MVHNIFVILNYASVFIMAGCLVIVCTHKESPMQKLATMVCSMLFISCLGFLIKVEAETIDALIIGQQLVYVSVTHSMFHMLLFIMKYCNFYIPYPVQLVFHGINLSISAVVLTLKHNTLFYKNYWMTYADGAATLEKEYGPFHTLAVGVFALYMVAAVVIAIIYSVKNIRSRSRYVWRLLIAVMIPCAAYIIPKITGDNNDLQPVAFAAFAVMVLVMIYRNNLYDVDNIASRFLAESMQEILIVFDADGRYKGANRKALEFFPELARLTIDTDVNTESGIIHDLLTGDISEYGRGNSIFDVEIRDIEEEGSVTGKVIWMSDITIQRRYEELLRSRNESLESEVGTLTDISKTDALTGLANRRAYDDRKGQLKTEGSPSGVTVCMLDLNGLKYINDTLGHSEGDRALIAAAAIINNAFSEIGHAYRIGGDEFSVFIDDANISVTDLEQRINSAMTAYNSEHNSDYSISYGFASAVPAEDASGARAAGLPMDELTNNADKNMYECKRNFYRQPGKKKGV